MDGEIEIFLGDVSDVEAHVFARYVGSAADGDQAASREPIVLRGTLRGPYCTRAHTLPAEFKFRDLGPNETGLAKAIVPDPCIWSPELPHSYQIDIAVRQGDRLLAEYHRLVGFRKVTQESGSNISLT
jgi:hypothetical protein